MFFLSRIALYDCENQIKNTYEICKSSYTKYLIALAKLRSNINFSVMVMTFRNYLTFWLRV